MLSDCTELTESLSGHHLLEDAAFHETVRDLLPQFEDAKQLADELVRRGWLTAFQKELILAGRAQELVLGVYVLLDKIGEGGMGAVYKARHRVLKAVRAIKVIRPDRLAGKGAVQRFYREAEVVAKLHHPNIILAHDAGEYAKVHYFVMEFAPGADLGQLLQRCGPLPPADACAYIRQAALGLEHARERGLIHRDIKPSNLLVTPDGQVKLLDLGLARICAAEEETQSGVPLTQDGAVMGTPDYMAPEQAEDSRKVDIRADIYSLGCTLYHVLTGLAPFPGGSVMEKLIKHRLEEPRPIEALRGDLPQGLAPVVRKMMAKAADARYQTPAEVAAALEPFSGGAGRPNLTHPAELAGTLLPDVIPGLADVLAANPTVVPGEPSQHTAAGQFSEDADTSTSPALPPHGSTERLPPSGLEETQLANPGSGRRRYPAQVPAGLEGTQFVAEAGMARTAPTAEATSAGPSWRGLLVAAVVLMALGAVGAYFLLPMLSPSRQGTDDRRADQTAVTPPTMSASGIKPESVSKAGSEKPAPSGKDSPVQPPSREPVVVTPPASPPAKAVARGLTGAPADLVQIRTRGPAVRTGGRGLSWSRRHDLYALAPAKGQRAAFSADGNRAVVGTTTDGVQVYNLRDIQPGYSTSLAELIQNLTVGQSRLYAVALSRDANRVLLATVGRSATPLDGNPVTTVFNMLVGWELNGAIEPIYGPRMELSAAFRCLAISPEGTEILVGGAMPQICRYRPGSNDLRSGRYYFKHGAGDQVNALTYSADGQFAASAGRDKLVCVFDATKKKSDGAPLKTLSGLHTPAMSVALSSGGRYALAGGREGCAALWDIGDDPAPTLSKPTQLLQWHNKDSDLTAVTFAPSNRKLFLTGSDDGVICLGEIGKDQPVWTEPSRGGGAILALAISADGQRVLVADEMGLGEYPLERDVTALARPAPIASDSDVPLAEAKGR